jgi:hypothetical protein
MSFHEMSRSRQSTYLLFSVERENTATAAYVGEMPKCGNDYTVVAEGGRWGIDAVKRSWGPTDIRAHTLV